MRLKSLVLISFWVLVGCRNTETKNTDSASETENAPTQMEDNQTELDKKTADTTSNKEETVKRKNVPKKRRERLFVSARSGLNYRSEPKGKVLGKFPLNTRLEVMEHTGIFEQIEDGGKNLKGEWVGVEEKQDTVYVFSAFLSYNLTFSEIKIYRANPFTKEKDGSTRTAFLNLSESYFNNKNSDDIILPEKVFKDTIRLNSKQRKKFLEKINVSESDQVFIFEIMTDSIYQYNVKDLPVIACLNIYFDEYNQTTIREEDYEFGLDLGSNYTGNYKNFAYLGNENPFQKGKLRPIIWTQISEKTNYSEIPEDSLVSRFQLRYKYETNKIGYFSNGNKLVVIDLRTDKIVFNKTLYESEGWFNVSDFVKNTKNRQIFYMEGELFKDKPSVFFGLGFPSFGCAHIFFSDESEPPIRISCDNRH